jgi:hypothetical protein
MIGMVIYSKTLDNSLVVDNYYEEDLAYQSHLDRVTNSQSLSLDLIIRENANDKSLYFQFPGNFQKVEGNVWFYRADDKTKDFKINITTNDNRSMVVPVSNLKPGRWTVKVNWVGDGKPFYKEEVIVL